MRLLDFLQRAVTLVMQPVIAFNLYFGLVLEGLDNSLEIARAKAQEEGLNQFVVVVFEMLFRWFVFPLCIIPFLYAVTVFFGFGWLINLCMGIFYESDPPIEHVIAVGLVFLSLLGVVFYRVGERKAEKTSEKEQ